jgi:ubiquitin-conjugating enzyme E2 O
MSLRLRTPSGAEPLEALVPASAARHVRALHAGDHVLYRQWLGRVEDVVDTLLLRFDDGAVCRVEEATRDRVAPRSRSTLFADEEDCPFYPGQRVRVDSPSVLRSHARFLSGGFRGRYDATVLAVEPGQARLRWLAAIAAADAPEGAEEPEEVQRAFELQRLAAFDDNTWQLGDRALIDRQTLRLAAGSSGESGAERQQQQVPPPASEATAAAATGGEAATDEGDEAEEEDEEEEASGARGGARRRRGRRGRRGGAARKATAAAAADAAAAAAAAAGDETTAVAVVIGTATFADVRWQDGSVSHNVPAVDLVPITHLVDTDFWPDEFVVEKSDAPADAAAVFGAPAPPALPPVRLGLVRSVDPAARTARVRWLPQHDGRAVLPDEDADADVAAGGAPVDAEAEVVSTYDIEPSPEHPARHGDVVLMLDAPAGTERDALPPSWWVGEVLSTGGGRLRVAWADGRVTSAAAEEVYVVTAEEDDGAFDEGGSFADDEEGGYWDPLEQRWVAGDSNGDGSSSGWATDEAEEEAEEEGGSDEEGSSEDEKGSESESATNGDEHADAQRPPRLLEGADAAPEVAAAAPQVAAAADDVAADEADAAAPGAEPARGSWFARLLTGARGDGASGDGDTTASAAAAASGDASGPLGGFTRFDSVSGAEDHHFFASAGGGTGNARSWARAVRREWDCLQAGLPGDIWARAYEERMDLLRVAIAGAEGTPYARHLLIFDLHFPETYPDEPLLAHYQSHGLRPNPNLYATGKVCLSLLGTWAGKEAAGETWQPGRSTCLQVLLSLQALVLVEKPYFNEAGWAGQAGSDEGERNARLYNEQVRLVMLRTAVAALRSPPRHLAELLRAHYAANADAILAAAEAELEGSAGGASSEQAAPPSEGYRASLRRLLPAVRAAFAALKAPAADARQ